MPMQAPCLCPELVLYPRACFKAPSLSAFSHPSLRSIDDHLLCDVGKLPFKRADHILAKQIPA